MKLLEKLKILPRYSTGEIELNDLTIHYNDPLALYHQYNDIFIQNIYHFEPSHKHPLILDVGGYIGLSTLYFKKMYPQSKVIVFEPDPVNHEILKKNIASNKICNVTVIHAGAGQKEGEILFYHNDSDGSSKFLPGQHGTAIKINQIKLSQYITEPVDMLKMNIEGMEWEVFVEIESKLPSIKNIIFEYHAFFNLPQHLGKILNILDKNGFRYLIADVPCAKTSIPFRMTKNDKNYNLVFAKNSTSN